MCYRAVNDWFMDTRNVLKVILPRWSEDLVEMLFRFMYRLSEVERCIIQDTLYSRASLVSVSLRPESTLS